MEDLKDLINFLIQRKAYWLAPVIFFILILSLLFVVGGNSAFAPFIYSLF